MLCSKCSREIKPVVAFDVDGTLGNYHGQLIEFTKAYINHEPPPEYPAYDGRMNFGDWMIEAFDLDGRKMYRDIKLAFRQGGSKRWMPPYYGMIDVVRVAQSQLLCEVWLTTTRPYMRLDSVDPDTREWLRRHNVPFDHLMYDDNKYELLVEYVDPRRIVAIIDDLPAQLQEAGRVFSDASFNDPSILAGGPYNSGIEYDGTEISIYDSNLLTTILRERVERWNHISRKLTEQSMMPSTGRSSLT